jgi:hypothetical protein
LTLRPRELSLAGGIECLRRAVKMVLSYAVALALAAGTPSAQAAAEPKPAKDEKICKKEQVTGSLARSRKTCMTRAEWNRMRNRGEEDYDRINSHIHPTNGPPGGG